MMPFIVHAESEAVPIRPDFGFVGGVCVTVEPALAALRSNEEFQTCLQALRDQFRKRPGLIGRLNEASL